MRLEMELLVPDQPRHEWNYDPDAVHGDDCVDPHTVSDVLCRDTSSGSERNWSGATGLQPRGGF